MFQAPVTMTTRAVIVQITTVSMNGSKSDTTPSRTGSSVLAAECAIAADPIPASFENTARLMPWMAMPTKPPIPASNENASEKIRPNAAGSSVAFAPRMTRLAIT